MKSSEDSTAAALDLHGLSDEETATGCFEFHRRTRSFDLHQTPSKHKLSKLANLLRSRSDGSVRSSHSSTTTEHSPKGSPRESPLSSPGPPTHRRFVRVVRDNAEADLENPHVTHKHSSEFLSDHQKSSSLDEHHSSPPPYTVTGHTILKKQPMGSGTGLNSSFEHAPESSPPLCQKHASFRDEVEVMEYDKKQKIRRGPLAKHKVRLHDSPVGSMEEEDSEGVQTSGEMGEGYEKKKLTFADSLDSASSLDVPSENSDFAQICTPFTEPPESSRTTGLNDEGSEGSECPDATPQILLNDSTGDEGSREDVAPSQTITESLQKLNNNSSGLTRPSNTGST